MEGGHYHAGHLMLLVVSEAPWYADATVVKL